MMQADWYFDFISPYAYFASRQLDQLSDRVAITCRPVLFAGLLRHWGQKGPAEIPSKREWTYRQCVWHARQHDIPMRIPAAHPFNPLPWLRLCLAAGNSLEAVHRIYAELWTTGQDAADPLTLKRIARELGVEQDEISNPEIKAQLQKNGEDAIAAGVFGVPTMVINGQQFWGADSLDFLQAYLDDPTLFQSSEMQRASSLPVGKSR